MKKLSRNMIRIVSLVSAMIMIACALIPSGAANVQEPLYYDMVGDINGDKIVNGKDIVALKAHMTGVFTHGATGADVNRDCAISVDDIKTLTQAVADTKVTSSGVVGGIQYVVRDGEGTAQGTYSVIENAMKQVDTNWWKGWHVTDVYGNSIYSYGTALQNKILTNAKQVADYMKGMNYEYGSNPKNPATDEGLGIHIVSCDRFVGWVLYDSGYTNQPTQLMVYDGYGNFSDLTTWCQQHNFIKIERIEDLQPGDIMFVNKSYTSETHTLYPGHTYIYAGKTGDGQYYRYDAGSENRIRCANQTPYNSKNGYASYLAYAATGQPFKEGIGDFMYAYRPQ